MGFENVRIHHDNLQEVSPAETDEKMVVKSTESGVEEGQKTDLRERFESVPDSTMIEAKRLYEETLDGKQAFLSFDLDGVLVLAGIGTAAVADMSMEQYMDKSETKEAIAEFKKRITRLRELGFKTVISTGRGSTFAREIMESHFGDEVDAIVCEGGAMVVQRDDNGDFQSGVVEGMSEVGKEILETPESRGAIIDYITKSVESGGLGGVLEEGKSTALSFNVVDGNTIKDLKKGIEIYLQDNNLIAELNLTNSETAVDITPRGADKLNALKTVVGEGVMAYFGDAPNDHTAMRLGRINTVPKNGAQQTKELAMKPEVEDGMNHIPIGILPDKEDIAGVNDSLYVIEATTRYLRKMESKKNRDREGDLMQKAG